MGKHEKKKHRRSSRSRSRERYHHKSKKKKDRKRHYSDSGDTRSSSRSPSPDGHRSKKKHRSRSHERSKSREKMSVADMEKMKEEKRQQKEVLKTLETPEEKRARRLAKKEAKERKRKEKMGWDEEYMGYTNTDNPFGDEQLLNQFVWQKKLDKDGMKHLGHEKISQLQRQKMIENKIELEKVKKRRLEREKEREEREQEREMLQREKEVEYFREWEKQEDSFHLNQAKMRSKIRIEDGRAKPIDLLAKYIGMEDDDFSVEMHEPYTYLIGLTISDLEDLLEDIKVYIELEEGKNVDFWKDITIITDDELEKLRKLDPNNRDYVGDRRTGINQSVTEDVSAVFKGKTLNQLNLLEDQIRKKLKGGEGVDVGYWETLLQQLKAHMARSRLRERHQEQLRRKLFRLKQEQGIESEPLFPIMRKDSSASSSPRSVRNDPPGDREEQPVADTALDDRAGPSTSTAGAAETSQTDEEDEEEESDEPLITEEDLAEQSYADYDAGSYSPILLQVRDLEPDTLVYDPEEDIKRLEYARQKLQKTGKARDDVDFEFEKKAREGMNNEEAQFSVEMPIEQSLIWSDKYRPRKPRFFNRVHTGFEWNKYNQTHYDIDNPPPKIVQGYKFNIFYPDLIDKTKTPEYSLTPIEGDQDFCVLRFHAGPPYEDIAFKIVNREWEYSYKRGFRCQFHNNIFQLWFHFKRYRYRR